jgi:hypothetical protein
MHPDNNDVAISITAPWDHWQSAQIRLNAFGEPHWWQPTGAPKPLLHGYVSCADIVSGTPMHACDPLSAPHRLHVCVLKRHNVPSIYAALAARADRVPMAPGPHPSPSGTGRSTSPTALTK